jgi:hypothetical protein
MLRTEFREHLAKEYRYAVTKMQNETLLIKKLYYFSVLFGDAQRILNWEWNRDLALVYMVVNYVYTQINTAMQTPGGQQIFPIDWASIADKLTQIANDLTTYFENTENKEGLCEILGRFAEISYAVSGNGSYLQEKGIFKL